MARAALSPAAAAIRDELRRRRPVLPRAIRVALLAGVVLLGLSVALVAYAYVEDRPLFYDMLRLYGLTLLAGREPAIFAVYQSPTPMPLSWMLVVAPLDDLATFFLTISWVWYGFERLHVLPRLQDWFLGLEKTALENRRFIRRWGLGGLVAFYWLPGFGTGVLAACVLGVLARIPLRILVPVMAVAAVVVSVFWTVALHYTSALLPSRTAVWLPSVVLAVVVGLMLVSAYRQRRAAHVLLLEWPAPTGARAKQLLPLGIRPHGSIVEVDSKVLAENIGGRLKRRARVRAVAELLLLDDVSPDAAVALAARGVDGVTDMALLSPRLLADALREEGLPVGPSVEAWQERARAFAAQTGTAWQS